MVGARTAARLGIGAGVTIVLLVLVTYAVADARAVGVYFGGLLGPPLAGLFAAVAAIALAGARRGNTDPATAAGVVLVFGLLSLGLLSSWATGVSPSLVGGMTSVSAFQYHRWALVAVALLLLVAGAQYTRHVI
jgi:LytS/YehU family sensor histidine kinase